MARMITITIDEETSKSTVDLTGFHGVGCADVMKAFDGLGTVKTDAKKPDFYQKQCQVVRK